MKKLMTLSIMALMLSTPYVMAEDVADGNSKRSGRGMKMFQQRDLDGDGYLSREEFIKSAEKRFEKIDLDNDGKISKSEAREHRSEMKNKMKQRKEKMQERSNNAAD